MAYTTIDDPSAYFQIKLWTGTGSSQTVNFDGNSDLQADWIWHKEQNDTNGWHQTDTSIGISNYLATQDAAAEYGVGSAYVSATGSNSISYGGGDSSFNSNSVAQATWAWKANGGTTASNTTGDINTTTQVNSDAGFSIVTYTGNGGTNQTVGHGLGVSPQVIIVKNREVSANWIVYHHKTGTSKYLNLDTAGAAADSSNIWGSSAPSSTTFTVQQHNEYNDSGEGLVAYCFADVQGYSKFGSYVGNGNADGAFVYLGFQPAFVLTKQVTDAAGDDWILYDNKREPENVAIKKLFPNQTAAESSSYDTIDMLSNGFKMRSNLGGTNSSGKTYIYMAFAENPFVTSTGIPTTAR